MAADQNTPTNVVKLIAVLNRLQSQSSAELKDTLTLLEASQDRVRVRQALKQLLPELAAHQILKQRHNDRYRQNRGQGRPGIEKPNTYGESYPKLYRAALNGVTWLNSKDDFEPMSGIWLQTFADTSEQNDRDDINGFDADSRGVAVGFDRDISKTTSLGISYSRISTDVDSNRFGRDDVTSDEYAGYSTSYFGNVSISTSINYSANRTDRVRVIRIQTDAGARLFALKSDIDASQLTGSVSIGWNTTLLDNIELSPFLNLSYAKLKTDDYLERGGGELNLLVETDDEEQIIGGIGLSLSYSHEAGNWLITPGFHLALEHDFKGDDTRTFSRFRGTDFGFESRGYSIEENRVRGGVSLGLIHYAGFSLQLGIDAEAKDDYTYLAASLGIRYGF